MFENEIVKLRALEPEDLDCLYEWENDSSLWDAGNTRQPYSRFALKQYISQVDTNIFESGQLRLMIVEKVSGETVGTVDLFDFDIHNSRIAFGLFVDSNFQGRGIATAALRLIESYVFEYLSVNQLYCHIAETNTASKTMFEKEKYEQNAILKNWIKTKNGYVNVFVFQRFK